MNTIALQKVWKDLLDVIKQHTDRPSYGRWLEPSIPLQLDADTLTLGVSNKFSKDRIEGEFLALLESDLSRVLDRPMHVSITIIPHDKKEGNLFEEASIPNLTPPDVTRKDQNAQTFSSNLSPKYVFENFVIGNSKATQDLARHT